MLGTMSMYFVTDPDGVVASIQSLLDVPITERTRKEIIETVPVRSGPIVYESSTRTHTRDISGKVRNVLE